MKLDEIFSKFSWGEFELIVAEPDYKVYESCYFSNNVDYCDIFNPTNIADEHIIAMVPDKELIFSKDKYTSYIRNIKPTTIGDITQFMIQIINMTKFEYLPNDVYCKSNTNQVAVEAHTYFEDEQWGGTISITRFDDKVCYNDCCDSVLEYEEYHTHLTSQQCEIIARYIYNHKEDFFMELYDDNNNRHYPTTYKDKYFEIVRVLIGREPGYILYARLKSNGRVISITNSVECGDGYSLKYVKDLCGLIMKGGI